MWLWLCHRVLYPHDITVVYPAYIQKYAHINSQDGLSDVLQPPSSQKTGLTSAVWLLCPLMFHTIKWGASDSLSCFISCKKNILQCVENHKCSTQVVFSFLKNWIIFPMKPCSRPPPPRWHHTCFEELEAREPLTALQKNNNTCWTRKLMSSWKWAGSEAERCINSLLVL